MGKAARVASFAASVLLAAVWCPIVFALNPRLDVSQYAHTAWRVGDGSLPGAVVAIAQTPDGYLWLGTGDGLLKFDGIKATPWQPPSGEALPSNRIISLTVTRHGALWISTYRALASWRDGRLTSYQGPEPSCGIPIVCDADPRVHDLSRGAALALFRIVQEALANAVKHSQATRIAVGLSRAADEVTLTVSDNGVGFDRSRLTTSGGLGLITMRERAGQLNGKFEFNSASGRGTTIKVVVPFR